MEIRLCDITNNTTDIREYFIVDDGKILINGAHLYDVILDTDKATLNQQMEMFDSKEEMFKKAQAFDEVLDIDLAQHDEEYADNVMKVVNKYTEDK
ncbi:hypothetical protein [Staphylococcus aureus]|uniref:hypothetical protein n=1 Tax=Staphylococcus aureus TaxID=1280 RepID=UPI00118AAD04|nr:hypothetical protein [Staphylococcus aureus]QDS45661.1 hypothetical protein FP477_00250 [Staphylococcus aureus]